MAKLLPLILVLVQLTMHVSYVSAHSKLVQPVSTIDLDANNAVHGANNNVDINWAMEYPRSLVEYEYDANDLPQTAVNFYEAIKGSTRFSSIKDFVTDNLDNECGFSVKDTPQDVSQFEFPNQVVWGKKQRRTF